MVAAAAKLLQACPTLREPIDSSPPGSSVHGIFQARVLECVAIAFSELWLVMVSDLLDIGNDFSLWTKPQVNISPVE